MRKRFHFTEMAAGVAGSALCALAVVASGCGADAGGGAGGGGAGGDPGEQRDGEIVMLQDSGAGGTPRTDAGPGGQGGGGAGGTGGAPAGDAALGGTPGDAATLPPDAATLPPDAATGAQCAGHDIIDLNAALADADGYLGTTDAALASLAASCGGAAGGEMVFKYHLDRPLDRLIFRTDYPETTAPTVLYVRRVCDEPEDLACNRGSLASPGTRATVEAPDAGDYYVVVDQGAREGGGPFRLGVELDGASACRDAEDNDGDGLIDLFDPGCSETIDESEADPAEVPECFDGVDNNENGLTDYPNDADCTAAGDTSEGPVCTLDLPFVEVNQGGGLFPTNLPVAGAGLDLAQAGCFFENLPEALFVLTLDRESNVRVTNQSLREAGLPVTLYARSTCEEPRSELACSDPFTGEFTLNAAPAGVYFIFAEASQGGRGGGGPVPFGGAVVANIDFTITPTHRACDDTLDNDRDGVIDLLDPGCRAPTDDDETDPNVQPFCANGQDDDGDGVSDFPADDGCTGAGDVCEGVGDDFCDGACIDVQSNPAHCGRCDRACDAGVECIEGRCGALRPNVLSCGQPGRPVNEFIRGDLLEAEVQVIAGCIPDDDTQALVVARNGVGEVQNNAAVIRQWVSDGGQLITEWNISDEIYNVMFGAAIQPGMWNGACNDNVQNNFQFTPEDPFWNEVEFIPVPNNTTPCGYNIQANLIPDFVPLLGWDANNVSMGYVELDSGRVWLLESDWQDGDPSFTDNSRDLMAAMISGSRRAPAGIACTNGRDDDADGLFDLDDPGCADAADADEADPPAAVACGNGRDDDQDGFADWPADLGCAGAGDDDEADAPAAPACANGQDDDQDGATDYPFDAGCQARGDTDEADPARRPACGNRRDDDGDGASDFPADPGCVAAGDLSELDPAEGPPACANGEDDDRDGLTDFPNDPGCLGAGDPDGDEADPAELPACANGRDDNGDRRSDYPLDPGCTYAADPVENDVADVPACANGGDDDGDGRADFPDDLGCADAADTDETDAGRPAPRCADRRDNDLDGLIDAFDLGCESARDDDETDPADPAVAWCSNGQDDDGDGNVDWPADDGCAAAGDACEQVGYIQCDGVCVDGQADATNCGECGNTCADGVECIEGFCGGLYYQPGIQQNLPEAGLNGWNVCYRGGFGDFFPIAQILADCGGRYVAMGCKEAARPDYTLLAMGERDQVFFDTGDQNSDVHEHNGVNWYFSQNYSIGFVPVNELPARNSCDTNQNQGEQRMCWHTGGNQLNPGYRCGNNYPGDGAWERVILTAP